MVTAERSRSVDSTTVGGSAGGTEAPTSPVLAPLGQQTNAFGGGDADDGANLVDAGRGDDQGGMSVVAAGRLLEAGDVVDAWHEHGGDTLEQTGEPVAVHGWKAWSWGILEASLAGVISPM